jgi:elongation factor Tu
MPVEDVFSISGRGTVVTGRVERASSRSAKKSRSSASVRSRRRPARAWKCSASCWTRARPATTSACCCAAPSVKDVERGQVLCKPGSITPHTKFMAEAYILTKEEGGRHTPFFTNYRPQFYFRTTDVTGIIKLPEGVEMIMPGDNAELDVELITPIAMDQGCASPFAKAAAPSAPASCRKSKSKLRKKPNGKGRPTRAAFLLWGRTYATVLPFPENKIASRAKRL